MNSLFVLADTAATTGKNAGSILVMVLYFAVLIGIMWFLIVRPQRKREKEVQAMLDSVKVGDTVLTTGGLYGKIVDMVNDICIIELGLNKGIRVPLQKSSIAAIKEPEMAIKKEEKEEVKKDDKKENK